MITAETINGNTYYSAEARGVVYTARIDTLGRWEVTSQRSALRAARMGGSVRHFASPLALAYAITAFHGFDQLVDGCGEPA